MLRDAEFWRLIDTIDAQALSDGDEEGAIEPLREALEGLEKAELEGFEEQLAQKLYAIDGKEYADAAGESGESGDGFLYARCYVVARGQAFYESVRKSPKAMPTSSDDWCELLLFAAAEAFTNSTGETWEFAASVSYETGSNTALW
ncbi:MAG: DUF4240 domain-containing protein [Myxococcota bacterium]